MKLRLARKVAKTTMTMHAFPRGSTAARSRARLTRRILSHMKRIASGRPITPRADKRDPVHAACGERQHMHVGGACPPPREICDNCDGAPDGGHTLDKWCRMRAGNEDNW